MTTIVYTRGILAADSRRTNQFYENGEVVRSTHLLAPKIRATRLFAAAGTGSAYLAQLCTFLPILLWLRWAGWAVVPYMGRLGGIDGDHTLCAVWRNNRLWSLHLQARESRLTPIFVIIRAKTRSFHIPPDSQLVLIGGSGSTHITIEDAQRLGAVEAVLLAATMDPRTNTTISAFDMRTWRLHQPAALPARTWWKNVVACWYSMFEENRFVVPETDQPPTPCTPG